MRSACVLVFTIACSTNHATTQSERPKDVKTQPAATADAITATGTADAMPEGPSEEEIEAALHALSSEHGARDVKNVEWWRKNGPYVRARLRAMLEDDTYNVMADDWAIKILGDIGDPADVPLLAKILSTHKSDTARHEAGFAIGKIPGAEASAALIAATSHENVNTASYATDGLGLRKDDTAARARLEELLNHAKSTMRFHAVNSLADLGGSKEALTKRRKVEKDAEVKEAIDKALKAKK